jgi:glutamate-1-semialdehyde 2,1-aminomutase
LLDRHSGRVAAIIMEPLRSELPPPGYLAGVKELAVAYGAVLIFDEVTSGFRVAVGGAQELLGVTPDVTVLGKAISNGYPMAAVVGRRGVMEAAARMFISSTYWSDTIGLRAALTTIRELKRRGVPAYLHRLGAEIQQRVNAAAGAAGLAARCEGLRAHPALRFQTDDAETRALLTTLYIQEMAKRGCHGYAAFYLNAAQGPAEVGQLEAAAREVFALLADGWRRDTLAALAECDLTQDAFRRLVR